MLVVFTVLCGAICSIASVFVAVILQEILDAAMAKDMQSFGQTVFFTVFYVVILMLLMYFYSLASKKLVCRIMQSMRSKSFEGIINHSMEDFSKVNTADYLSALNNDIKMVEDNYLLPLLEILQYGSMFIASLAVMIYFNSMITVVVFVLILCMFIVPGVFGGAMQKKQNLYSGKLSLFTINTKDLLSGFEIIKSYCIKKKAVSKFNESNKETINAKFAVDKLVAANEAISHVFAVLIQIVVIFLAAYFIITAKMTAGALLALVQVSGMLVTPLLVVFDNAPKLKSAKPIIERLNGFADYGNSHPLFHQKPSFERVISAKNISFSYNNEKTVLNGVSLDIQKNKKYAIVGKSGCGKTTLIKLLMGYYSSYSGYVLYDDTDVSIVNYEELAGLSAIIHQNVYMFDETIQDNICLHDDFSQTDLERALAVSGVDLFLPQIPNQIFAEVGENGAKLSGGQKQRIAVARAIIQKKPILVLDEGTSAIDRQTAYDIEGKLLKIQDLTLITITHNMSKDILELYDQIVFMDNGTIQELGTFDELTSKKGAFYDFCNLKNTSECPTVGK